MNILLTAINEALSIRVATINKYLQFTYNYISIIYYFRWNSMVFGHGL